MEIRPLPFHKILFVCTNERAPGERVCCAAGGAVELHAELKQWVKDSGFKRYIRVCKSGCMDRCESGPNVLVMPDNQWIADLDRSGVEALKATLAREIDEIRRAAREA